MKIFEFFKSQDIRTGSIGSVVIKLIGTIFTFSVSVILARLLGLDGYGVYILVFSTVMLLSIPLTFGLPLLLNRYIPKYEVENNDAAIKGLLIKANQFIFIAYAVIALFVLAFYFIFGQDYDPTVVTTAAWGLVLLGVMGFNAIRAAALQGMRYIILGQLPDTLLRTGFLLLGLLLIEFIGNEISPDVAMAVHVAAAALSYIIGFMVLKVKLLNKLRGITPMYQTRSWLSQSFQFSLNMGVNSIKTRISTYILAIFSGTAAVALFEVALKGANLVSFALNALITAITPHISKTYEEGNTARLQSIIKKASRVIFAFSLPVAFVFIFGGNYIIEFVFGIEYTDSYWPLVILCIGQLVNSFAGTVGLLLIMTGRQGYVVRVNALNVLFNILLTIALVMQYDVIGAAIAYACLQLIQNAIFVWYAWRNLRINTTVL